MDEDYTSEVDSASSFDSDEDYLAEDQNYIHNSTSKRRSYVWKYFDEIPNNPKAFECNICRASVGAQTCNLGRHLQTVHNITGHLKSENDAKRGRPSRSFIWKYCTRENEKQAFCHLCKKLLYFGGGNTSNVAKHLRRIHADIIENNGEYIMDHNSPELVRAEASITSPTSGANIKQEDIDVVDTSNVKKERKGGSYVWKYCTKLSKHTVRCKLCDKVMSFHGTANVITHLQRRHNIVSKSDSVSVDMIVINEDGTSLEPVNEDVIVEEEHEETKSSEPERDVIRGFRGTVTSVVWKYCKRIDKDTVRCSFCNKNLSYQGTSNLQRHLHRMHGVATSSRNSNADTTQVSLASVWEHCTAVNANKIKCNMCNALFDYDDNENMHKHVVITHGVSTNKRGNVQDSDEVSYLEEFDELDRVKDETIVVSTADEVHVNKRYDISYEDIIEEDVQETGEDQEEHVSIATKQDGYTQLDSNAETTIVQQSNPLSPQTSEEADVTLHFNDDNDSIGVRDTKRMRDLKEERVRMQAEYFREKAAYYRMQKYLTALQAKKVRTELQEITTGYFIATENAGHTVGASEPGYTQMPN